jgi:hypothetical protein
VVEGTTVSMPETPPNQAASPQNAAQKPGLGLALVRLVVPFSLAVGTVLNAALGRCQGKRTGATALCHGLHEDLDEGDLLLADRCYSSSWELALAQRRGGDLVARLHQRRRADFRRGHRLRHPFWQLGGGYDRNSTSTLALRAAIDYIHAKPVPRGLVTRAEDGEWSSGRCYAGVRPVKRKRDGVLADLANE